MADNYAIQVANAQKFFLTYDQEKLIKKFGLHIPDDLSVIGYDNNEYSDIVFPPLTTIDILSYDIGKHAARLMLDILQSDKQAGSEAQTKVIISPQLIVRESTAKKV